MAERHPHHQRPTVTSTLHTLARNRAQQHQHITHASQQQPTQHLAQRAGAAQQQQQYGPGPNAGNSSGAHHHAAAAASANTANPATALSAHDIQTQLQTLAHHANDQHAQDLLDVLQHALPAHTHAQLRHAIETARPALAAWTAQLAKQHDTHTTCTTTDHHNKHAQTTTLTRPLLRATRSLLATELTRSMLLAVRRALLTQLLRIQTALRYWKHRASTWNLAAKIGTVWRNTTTYLTRTISSAITTSSDNNHILQPHSNNNNYNNSAAPATPQQHIHTLRTLRSVYRKQVGRVQKWLVRLHTSLPHTHSAQQLAHPMLAKYAHNVFRFVTGRHWANHEHHKNDSSSATSEHKTQHARGGAAHQHQTTSMTPAELLALVDQCSLSLPELEAYFAQNMQAAAMPSHLARYWLHYVAAGTVLVLGTAVLYPQRGNFKHWTQTVKTETQDFMRNRFVDPVRNVWGAVANTFKPRDYSGSVDPVLQVRASRDALTDMIRSFGEGEARLHSAMTGEPWETRIVDITNRARQGDMTVVMDRYVKDIERPVRSLFAGELMRAMLIQLQKMKLDGEELLVEVEKLMLANELTFELLALIPTVILLGIGLKFINSFLMHTLFGRSTGALHAEIRREVQKAERLLVKLSNSVNGGESTGNNDQGSDMTAAAEVRSTEEEDLGHLVFHFFCLGNLLESLTDKRSRKSRVAYAAGAAAAVEARRLSKDVNILLDGFCSIHQQQVLIAAMYRSYGLLST